RCDDSFGKASFIFFFFFQAEDGIRDKLVTGVQTCALPILIGVALDVPRIAAKERQQWRTILRFQSRRGARDEVPLAIDGREKQEIGRASCREREEIKGEAEALKEKTDIGQHSTIGRIKDML